MHTGMNWILTARLNQPILLPGYLGNNLTSNLRRKMISPQLFQVHKQPARQGQHRGGEPHQDSGEPLLLRHQTNHESQPETV